MYMFYGTDNRSNPGQKQYPKQNNLSSTRGQSTNGFVEDHNGKSITDPVFCNSQPQSNWFLDSCQCVTPFFSDRCHEEAVSNLYYDIGMTSTILGTGNDVNRLSFPYTFQFDSPFSNQNQIICTNLCDQSTDCVGVMYIQGPTGTDGIKAPDNYCGLLTDLDSLTGLTFSSSKQGNVFLKKPNVPYLPNQGLVYRGTFPTNRYWVASQPNAQIVIRNGNPALYNLAQGFPSAVFTDLAGKFVFSNDPTKITSGTVAGNGVKVYDAPSGQSLPVNFSDVSWQILYIGFY